MGADIVIAVYLDTCPFNKDTLESLVGVAGRNVQILIAANARFQYLGQDSVQVPTRGTEFAHLI
jgi:hypothetical protein